MLLYNASTFAAQISNEFFYNQFYQLTKCAKANKNDRSDSKFEKIIEKLEEKDAENSANDKLNFPYLDGTFLFATKNKIDSSRPCDAIEALVNDIKQWTMNFNDGAARPCGKNLAKTSFYSPPGGALKGQEINKKMAQKNFTTCQTDQSAGR